MGYIQLVVVGSLVVAVHMDQIQWVELVAVDQTHQIQWAGPAADRTHHNQSAGY